MYEMVREGSLKLRNYSHYYSAADPSAAEISKYRTFIAIITLIVLNV